MGDEPTSKEKRGTKVGMTLEEADALGERMVEVRLAMMQRPIQ